MGQIACLVRWPVSVVLIAGAVIAVSAPADAGTMTCLGRTVTIVGTSGDDRIYGTQHADVILARAGDDIIRARGGDDVVCGGDGADVVYAGGGSDTVVPGAGDDRAYGGEQHDWFERSEGDDRLFGGSGADSFSGDDPGSDRLLGGSGGDYVVADSDSLAVPGRDVVFSGDGNDYLAVVASDGVRIDAGTGDDRVQVRTAATAPSLLLGGSGTDEVAVGASDSSATARLDQRSGRLAISDTSGLFRGWEMTTLYGDLDWTYIGHDAEESLIVYGGSLIASMHGGGDAVDYLGVHQAYIDLGDGDIQFAHAGSSSSAVLIGGPGWDQLSGGGGDDVLDGGAGLDDELYGGSGYDVGRDPDGARMCQGLEVVPDGCKYVYP